MRAIVGAVCFGLVAFGETPAEAAVRELAEETGVRAESCEQRAHLLL